MPLLIFVSGTGLAKLLGLQLRLFQTNYSGLINKGFSLQRKATGYWNSINLQIRNY